MSLFIIPLLSWPCLLLQPSDSLSFSQTGCINVPLTLACSSVRDFPLANPFAWNTFPWDIWMACSVTILLSLLFSPWHSETLYILLLTFYNPSSHQDKSSLRARNFICLIQEFSKCLEEWLANILLNRYLSEWMNRWMNWQVIGYYNWLNYLHHSTFICYTKSWGKLKGIWKWATSLKEEEAKKQNQSLLDKENVLSSKINEKMS